MDTQFNMWTRIFDDFMVIGIITIYPIAVRFNHILIYLNPLRFEMGIVNILMVRY